jgi:hypothetical protein
MEVLYREAVLAEVGWSQPVESFLALLLAVEHN